MMTEAEDRLKAAIKAHSDERYYNGHIPSWATELADAAAAYMYQTDLRERTRAAPSLRDVFPDSEWEVEQVIEGGQPNGIGEIEENSSREWFRTEWETHHRTEYHIFGKWEYGPTPEEAERRRKEAERLAKLAADRIAEHEANRESEEDAILAKAQEILARREAASA